MTIEDAICTLNALKKEALDDYESYPRRAWALDTAIAALREQKERRWIPVTERLPEKFVSVLVFSPSEAPLPTVHEGFWAGSEWAAGYGMKGITHWMPMPEPPKEDAK